MLLYPNWQRETAQTRYSLGPNPRGSTIDFYKKIEYNIYRKGKEKDTRSNLTFYLGYKKDCVLLIWPLSEEVQHGSLSSSRRWVRLPQGSPEASFQFSPNSRIGVRRDGFFRFQLPPALNLGVLRDMRVSDMWLVTNELK